MVNALGAIMRGALLLPLLWITSLPVAVAVLFAAGFVWAPFCVLRNEPRMN